MKKQTTWNKRNNGSLKILLAMAVIIALAVIFIVNLFHYTYNLNADIAAETILGQQIGETGQIIPSEWYPSSEVRILGNPLLAGILYRLTGRMNLSMGISCCLMTLLIVASLRFFLRAIGMRCGARLLTELISLSIATSLEMLGITYLFAGYYAIHIVIMFYTLGVYGRILGVDGSLARDVAEDESPVGDSGELDVAGKRDRDIASVTGSMADKSTRASISHLHLALSLALAFLIGMQGARAFLVLYGPLFGMELLRQIGRWWRYRIVRSHGNDATEAAAQSKAVQSRTVQNRISNPREEQAGAARFWQSKDRMAALWGPIYTMALFLLNVLGMKMPVSVGQDTSRNMRAGFSKLISEVIPDAGLALGFHFANPLGKVMLCILLIAALLVLFWILAQLFKTGRLTTPAWLFLIFVASPILSMIAVAFTTTETTARYYFFFLYTIAIGCGMLFDRVGAAPENDKGRVQPTGALVQYGLVAAAVLLMIANLVRVYVPILISSEPPEEDAAAVARYLVEQNYEIAYADFEYAGTMTVYVDGAVRVAAVADLGSLTMCKWLSSAAWYVPNVPAQSNTAYVVTSDELEDFETVLAAHGDTIHEAMQIGDFYIFESEYNYSRIGE